MGSGRDGGRDMYVDGRLIWNDHTPGVRDGTDGRGEAELQAQMETWSGYRVPGQAQGHVRVAATGERRVAVDGNP